MKAIINLKYGPPNALQLREVEKPVPKTNELLIKIHATAINDFDWGQVRGKPLIYRLIFGLLKPKHPIPGIELSGTVEEVGKDVTTFKVGDEVYGDISALGWGSFAEYSCVHEKTMVHKSPKMTFEEAASLPHASMLALQGLIDVGKIQWATVERQKILINGAGGGVGTVGLQLAKLYDAEVTGVDTGKKLQMMQSIGFDHIIDYKKEDFTASGQQYDLILDAKTNRPPSAYAKVLAPHGRYVTVGGDLHRLVQILISGKFGKKNMHVVALEQNKDLAYINELYETGKIKPVIDGPYKLEEAPKVLQYFGEGRHQGKVVISMMVNDKRV